MTEPSVVIATAGLLFTILSAFLTVVIRLAQRLTALETKMEVFWKGVSIDMAHALHSPHPEWARRDQLIERYVANKLTQEEAIELAGFLQDILAKDESDVPSEYIAASVLLRILSHEFGITVKEGDLYAHA